MPSHDATNAKGSAKDTAKARNRMSATALKSSGFFASLSRPVGPVPRTVLVNIPHPPNVSGSAHVPHVYASNKIKTSRYTALSFVPKNLAEQYRSIANFYFTALVVLQCISVFSTASPVLNAAPIVIILIITAIKDGIEDVKRHQSDGELNHRPTYIISNWHNYNTIEDNSKWGAVLLFFHNMRKNFFKGLATVVLSPYKLATYRRRKRRQLAEELAASSDPVAAALKRQPSRILPSDYAEMTEIAHDGHATTGVSGKKLSDLSATDLRAARLSVSSSGATALRYPHDEINVQHQPHQIPAIPLQTASRPTSRGQHDILATSSTNGELPVGSDTHLRTRSSVVSTRFMDGASPTTTDAQNPQHHVVDTTAHRKSLNRLSLMSFRHSTKEREIWKLMQWEHVKVGDFIFLRDNDDVPADVVIITTSEPENNCFVETKSLDGETNLKNRVGIRDLASIRTPSACAQLKATIDVEPPNTSLHTFSAAMHVYQMNDQDPTFPQSPNPSLDRTGGGFVAAQPKVYPVNINGLLLRGSIVRNTKWVIGIAVYTGADTKIMMNAGITPSKRSRIDRQLNPQVIVNFMVLLALCLVCATLSSAYQLSFRYFDAPWVGIPGSGTTGSYSAGHMFWLTFFLSMILFQNIIPIALVISVEGTKLVQSFMIFLDDDLFDKESERRCVPNCWNLCDDLGQIEYIFSDKTGTLTSNTMEFRRASINGVVYGDGYVTEAMIGAELREGNSADVLKLKNEKNALAADRMRVNMAKLFDTKYVSSKLDFIDEKLHLDLMKNDTQAGFIREFFTLLSLCHTALVEKSEDGDMSPGNKYVYRSQSPDETSLVRTAKDVGFTFLGKKDGNMLLDIMGVKRVYQLLNILEFDSDRKRMSVILRRPEGDIIMLTKGADSVIYERLDREQNSQSLVRKTTADLEMFANEGLRTLVLAYRSIPVKEYEQWNRDFKAAQALIANREEEVARVSSIIERDLILMGATAIEDKLQEGVPETIKSLGIAGIKIWVLTGDKMETAINIGYACNLLEKESELITIYNTPELTAKQQLIAALKKHWTADGEQFRTNPKVLVIDGETLKEALRKSTRAFLLELGCRCKAVICCRASPLQKAQVVKLVRDGLGSLCLAIGDGANDVSMIQSADVGIGISGKEGMQAVMAADYSFGQFRFLKKLMLVHGRWAYIRTAEMSFNFFFKNGLFLFVLFWYQFDDSFSATFVIEYTFNVFYNTVFTILTTLAIGTFDQDIDSDTLMKYPRLYLKGLQQTVFTMERFWLCLFDAIYQSCVIYFFGRWIFREIAFSSGIDARMDDLGTFLAWNIILLANFNGAVTIFRWSWIISAAFIVTVLAWMTVCLIFVSSSYYSGTYGQQHSLFASASFWFGFFLVVLCALAPKLIFKFVQRVYFPTDSDIIREDSVFNKHKVKLEEGEEGKQHVAIDKND